MKSPLMKFRGFGHHNKSDSKDKKDQRHHRPPARLDELVQATQDMLDMKSCYDSLLSAAAAAANSSYELSEALEEMGTCLLEKTALNEDEDSGRVLLMLGKVQFELQKLVDSYRTHIIQTITTPSESLLKELQTVEEMKQQCDEKREYYKLILGAHREKGRSKHSKGQSFRSQQLQEAQDDYEEEVNLFVFRLKSLKQGQSRSLLTQSARHHAAQLNFFRKGLKSLEVVEPYVKVVAEKEHIDYQFSGLEDDNTEDDYDDYYSYDGNEDGELSFDYGQNGQDQDVLSSSTNSMELDQVDRSAAQASTTELAKENVERRTAEPFEFNPRPSTYTQSAPIFPNKIVDPSERMKVLRPSSTRKFHTYALPTPADAKRSISTSSVNPGSIPKVGGSTQLWHSSPLEPYKNININSREILKESNINSGPIKLPPPLSDELSSIHRFNQNPGSDPKKIKRQAFSGPITSRNWANNLNYSTVEHPHASSLTPARASPNVSPPPLRSPKITELHELPRPPISSQKPTRPTSLIGHSAPLANRSQELNKTSRTSPMTSSHTATPLPTPPAAASVLRSYSIPSRRMPLSPVAKFLEDPDNKELGEGFASPPLTPMMIVRPESRGLEPVRTRATRPKGLSIS